MLGLVFGPIGQILAFVVALVALYTAASLLERSRVTSAVCVALFVLGLFGAYWFGTTIIVPQNTVVLVVDTVSGRVDGDLRKPGLASAPLLGRSTFEYPTYANWQWCPTFTTSVRGGAGVTAKICYTIDAGKIDWLAQFHMYNGDAQVVYRGWINEMVQDIDEAMATFDPRQLSDNRAGVVEAIGNATDAWWRERVGVVPLVTALADWDFTNTALGEAYDAALLSQTQIDIAEFERQAAEIARDTAYINADTQVEVAKRLAAGHLEACRNAGMNTPEACIEYLRVSWLYSQDAANLIVSIGGDTVPAISFPSSGR